MMRNQETRRLDFYEEAIGVLSELTRDEGFLIVRISKVVLILPPEMENKLRPLVGTRMEILRTDIPQKEYLVRIISGGESPALEEAGPIRSICVSPPEAMSSKLSVLQERKIGVLGTDQDPRSNVCGPRRS